MTDIGVYYFPNYHPDARNAKWHGKGWTEWELVKAALPRFPGHRQPRVPVWGYEDESDPAVMARKIDAAADHGVTSFIFDWYWYNDGPFLQRCLEEGFLGAPNNDRLKFAIMWANHDWFDIHPATRSRHWANLAPGKISEAAFDAACERMLTYFRHPSYWRVRGGLYFSIYELNTMVDSLGGYENTRNALERFRRKVRDAGLGELHINAVTFGIPVLKGETVLSDPNELVQFLGIDSVTGYVWVHHVRMTDFPYSSYEAAAAVMRQVCEEQSAKFSVPYFPNVTMGWDSSPRTIQADVFDNLGYPFTPILDGATPEAFEKALADAKNFGERSPKDSGVITINAWNEWTEGSYLEPDTVYGMQYLEAIRKVFGIRK